VIEVAANKSVRIHGVKGFESWGEGPERIRKALTTWSSMQETKPFATAAEPRVVLRIEPSVDLKTVFELLKIARNGASELSVEFAEFSYLRIPPEPDDRSRTEDLMPNPLFLIAALDTKGAVTLNNEASGTDKDLSTIESKLRDIFKERERQGIFRENTNDVEKTVFVRVPESARFADLISFAKAISRSGADSLWLAMEKIRFIEDPPEILTFDSIIKRKPTPKPKP
jgi:biopolymer transport protein ExbD